MKYSILNFPKKDIEVKHETTGETLYVPDYFTYYISGIQKIVFENQDSFFKTKRFENERSEVLSFKFYGSGMYSDTIILSNNDNYLWDSAYDWEMTEEVTNQKLKYIQELNKNNLTEDERLYWENKIKRKIEYQNTIRSTVIAPKVSDLNKIIRLMKKYIRERTVR